jgi:hypothetical protein
MDKKESRKCPKGQRRNRKTNECEPFKRRKPKTTKKRCPKGQRRNRTTKKCEPSQMFVSESPFLLKSPYKSPYETMSMSPRRQSPFMETMTQTPYMSPYKSPRRQSPFMETMTRTPHVSPRQSPFMETMTQTPSMSPLKRNRFLLVRRNKNMFGCDSMKNYYAFGEDTTTEPEHEMEDTTTTENSFGQRYYMNAFGDDTLTETTTADDNSFGSYYYAFGEDTCGDDNSFGSYYAFGEDTCGDDEETNKFGKWF